MFPCFRQLVSSIIRRYQRYEHVISTVYTYICIDSFFPPVFFSVGRNFFQLQLSTFPSFLLAGWPAGRPGVRRVVRGPFLEGDGGVLRRGRRPLHGDRRRPALSAARGGAAAAGSFTLQGYS